jgi:hypothetical protein
MKKYLIVLIIIAGVCYYYNPPFENHVQAIIAEAPKDFITTEKVDDKIHENLDFINLFVASATKDRQRLSIVTFGALQKVFVIDSKWLPWVFKGRP